MEPLGDLQCFHNASVDDYTAHNLDFQAASGYEDSSTEYMTETQNRSYNYANETPTATEILQSTTSEEIFTDTFGVFAG